MKAFKNIMLTGLIPGAFMAVIAFVTDMFPSSGWKKIFVIMGVYVVSIILIQLIYLIWTGWAQSYFDLWHIGKIRGLWRDKGLARQIEKNFYTSNSIKIKVTRGVELLKPTQECGFVKELALLKDGKGKTHKSPVNIQVLLVLPCYQEAHVCERRQAHQELNDNLFLKSWYQFLDDIRKFDSEHLSINVRFYFGTHARWRFYIFEKANANKNTCVLLSEYDKNLGGIEKPMYRIMRGEHNIAGFMCKYFDELWNQESTFSPRELYEYIQTQKCASHFCVNCDVQGNSNCTNCKRTPCEFEKTCKELSEQYKSVLLSFNAGGSV